MVDRDFRKALRDAEAGRSAELDPIAEVRLRRKVDEGIERSGRSRVRAWGVAFASLAAAGAALVFVFSGPARVGGFGVVGAGDVVASSAGVSVSRGISLVSDKGATVAVLSDAVVRDESDGVRVVGGQVRIDVRKRMTGERAFSVGVSGGRISVLGTSFTIEERGGSGSVALHEGRIRFRFDDGVEVELAPGESLRWPRETIVKPVPAPVPAVPTPPVEVVKPEAPAAPKSTVIAPEPAVPGLAMPAPIEPVTPTLAPPPVADEPIAPAVVTPEEKLRADAVLKKVAGLRARGRFDEAVGAVEVALSDRYAVETRERLSFERLSMLAFQVRDSSRTCAALLRHVDEFGEGRYAEALQQVRREAACEPRP